MLRHNTVSFGERNPNAGDRALLSQVAQTFRSLADTILDQIGLHRAQATVLCRLFVQDGLTQSENVEQLGVQGASVTHDAAADGGGWPGDAAS